MKWYRDTSIKSHFCHTGQGGYEFCIDKVNWTGFTREDDIKGRPLKVVEDTAHTLFSQFAETLLDSFKVKVNDSTYLNKLLHIPEGDYSAVLLYVGFKADTSVFASRELMARFPVYDIDFVAAGKGYVMTSRPWWRDATDKERREKFSWQDSIGSYKYALGLSTPYPTIRKKSPNQRALWVEIPIEGHAAMFMCIDLLRND